MDFGIRDKVAFVAGGSKGMGRATALALGEEGCKVLIVAREQGPIDAVVAEIRTAGGTAEGISADLSTAEGIAHALEVCRSHWDMPDIVIAQTNDFSGTKALTMSPETVEEVFRILTAKEPETRFSHAPANIARPATSGFLKTLSTEVAADGVTVNTVAPGWTLTPTLEHLFIDLNKWTMEQGTAWLKETIGIPVGRAGKPEEIGATVAFLCSQQAAFITGGWILVDGGQHFSIM